MKQTSNAEATPLLGVERKEKEPGWFGIAHNAALTSAVSSDPPDSCPLLAAHFRLFLDLTTLLSIWSGRGDLNARPPAPKTVSGLFRKRSSFNCLRFKHLRPAC